MMLDMFKVLSLAAIGEKRGQGGECKIGDPKTNIMFTALLCDIRDSGSQHSFSSVMCLT